VTLWAGGGVVNNLIRLVTLPLIKSLTSGHMMREGVLRARASMTLQAQQ
jgi:hypothetical protein